MALKPGTQAPDFVLPSTSGHDFHFSEERRGKASLLYFYPKDFTSECTRQACAFRDQFELLRSLEVEVLGISQDSIKTHLDFKQAYQLPFELLSDKEGKVAKAYDTRMPFLPLSKRISYLVDRSGQIVAAYSNLWQGKKHLHKMLEAVQEHYKVDLDHS